MFSTKNELKIVTSISGLLLASMVTGCSANAKDNHEPITPEFKVDSCEEDYEDVNFCSDQFVEEYLNAIDQKSVNFNYDYILHFIDSGYDFVEVVAINPESMRVIPLGVEIKPSEPVEFSTDSDTLCFAGDISGYRQDNSYSHVCYTLEIDLSNSNPDSSGLHFVQSAAEF